MGSRRFVLGPGARRRFEAVMARRAARGDLDPLVWGDWLARHAGQAPAPDQTGHVECPPARATATPRGHDAPASMAGGVPTPSPSAPTFHPSELEAALVALGMPPRVARKLVAEMPHREGESLEDATVRCLKARGNALR